jgi:chromate transporter
MSAPALETRNSTPEAEAKSSSAAVVPVSAVTNEPEPKSIAVVEPSFGADAETPYLTRLGEVAAAFLPLGFLAFGGPQAHIAMFLKEFVQEKKWLDEDRFLELMSLGQAMPGPTSTQMATAIGITRAGWLGGLVSFVLFDWVGFVVCLVTGSVVNAYVEGQTAEISSINAYKEVIVGMGPAAISQVFIAAYTLGGKACGSDPVKVGLAVATCLISLLLPSSFIAAFSYLGMMIVGGLITIVDSRRPSRKGIYPLATPANKELLRRMGMAPSAGYSIAFSTAVLFAASWAIALSPNVAYGSEYGKSLFALFQTLFKMGSTIYGGGQVVLPMLEIEFTDRCGESPNYVDDFAGSAVANGGCQWVSRETFAFGLALSQGLPGPLFNFSAFLGAAFLGWPGGFIGFIGAASARRRAHTQPAPRPVPRPSRVAPAAQRP